MRKDRMFWSTAALSMVFLIHFGFTISTVGMQGVDVCATCHINATCEEKADGHKVCNCMYGFVGNGRTHCQDKDECQIGANKICGNHTACHNTYGSFYCTCLTGYHPSNNMATFIPNDGTFCDDIDECRVQGICGEGAHCSNVQGSFNCRCQVGYRLENGQEPFRPSHDKSHCTAVDCGPPRSAGRAILLSFTGTSYLSQAVFGCSEGFRWKSGNTAAVCGAERVWEGPSLVCEEIKCGDPPVLPHATHQWNGSTAVGTKVEYLCNEGLRPVGGEHTSICGGRGTWTNVTLQCKEVDCGEPPSFPHAAMLWNQSSRVGAQVHYQCCAGFYNAGKGNVSLCTADGYWDPVDILCQEVDCGEPPSLPHAAMLWNQSSRVGAQVHYQCRAGFYNAGKGNVSLCTAGGYWDPVDILCQEVDCGEPPSFPHAAMLWNQSSRVGAQVHYQCRVGFYNAGKGNVSLCTADGYWDPVDILCQALCGPAPQLLHAVVEWQNGTVAVHRCQDGYRSRTGSNISVCDHAQTWHAATLICREVKPPISKVEVFNESCLRWKAEMNGGNQEHYTVQFVGSRAYQKAFQDKQMLVFKSGANRPELCMNLLPGTNYSINITAQTANFSLTVSANTSIQAPPVPHVTFRDVEGSCPTLGLHRTIHPQDAISVYQVFVLLLEGKVVFDCSSPRTPHFYGCREPCQEYITAEVQLAATGRKLFFTVGDQQWYGGYYNAPLENGKDYYIILRAVSQWAGVRKQYCVIWAKVKGASYIIESVTLLTGGSIGLVAFIVLLGYSYTWYCKKQ
ncbi:sushi domain-containing protein 1 isoform X26 [Brienomyrus brachyistius]|uniref:sushi domain-containing protein 1 isoform X23 n=1 Tax=Brienomyrus brachyistius TaxID=42636 RepID=UPI0020B2DAF0|nr:sushi domain-containing protein 1 isoform X23 [Brienomyrus brachyistius]XP_048837249.1 sushi domain-containing protein 1 isoform X26 [Brienomyrus brachyistius]